MQLPIEVDPKELDQALAAVNDGSEVSIPTEADEASTAVDALDASGLPLDAYAQEDGGVGEGAMSTALDIMASPARGAFKAVENTSDNLAYLGEEWLGIPGGNIVWDEKYTDAGESISWLTLEEQKARGAKAPLFGMPFEDDGVVGQSKTTVGKMVESTVTWLSSFAVTRGLLGGAGGLTAQAAKGAVASAGADAFGFKAQEARLSNLMRDLAPELGDSWVTYLAHDEGDTVSDGMLKNALEGSAVGAVAGSIFSLAKAVRKARAGKPEEAEKLFNEALDSDPNFQAELLKAADDPKVAEELIASGRVVAKQIREQQRIAAVRQPGFDKDALAAELLDSKGLTDFKGTEVFNWSRIDNGGEMAQAWKGLTESMEGHVNRYSTGDRLSFIQMRKMANEHSELIGVDPDQYFLRLRNDAASAESKIATMLSAKALMTSLSNRVEELARRPMQSEDTAAELIQALEMMNGVHSQLKDLSTSFARGTAAGRIKTADLNSPELVTKIIEEYGGQENMERIADMVRLMGPKGVLELSKKDTSWYRKGVDVVNEYFINSLLSGVTTQAVNLASTSARVLLDPTEKMLGSLLTGNKEVSGEAAHQFVAMFKAIPYALRIGARAFKMGDNVLDPQATHMEDVSHAIAIPDGTSWLAHGVNAIGTAVRLPSRLLLTGDEVFKNIAYRAELEARLMRQSMSLGDISQAERRQWVADKLADGYDHNGRALDKDAQRVAQQSTFTTPLEAEGRAPLTSSLKSIQTFLGQRPEFRQFVPFVRTPWNIVADVASRTPVIAQLNPELRRKLMDPDLDPAEKARLYGQMATGTTAIASASMLAQSGNITGAGPKDYKVRERWMAAGWQPYSVRTQNEDGTWDYRSYNRADPMGMFFSLVANWHEISQNITVEDNEAVMATILAGTEALSSKTFLQGAFTLMDLVRDGHVSAVASHVSAYAPNLFTDAGKLAERIGGEQVGDGQSVARHTNFLKGHPVQEFMGKFYAKIPWMNDALPKKINIITGNVVEKPESSENWYGSVNIAAQSHEEGDPVLTEMKRLKMRYEPPAPKIGGYQMTKEEYEEYQMLVHQPSPSHPSLHEALAKVISHKDYQAVSPRMEQLGRETDVSLPSRDRIIRKVIMKYKKAGQAALAKKHSHIGEHVIGVKKQINATKGNAEAVKALLDNLRNGS